jgi:hypothetical protein
MAKKANPESVNEPNIENDSPYLNDAVTGDAKRNWLSSRAAKITAIAVGSSLALGAAFAGGAAAGQIAGGAPGGEFGMKQSGPQFEGDRHSGQDRKAGPDGQRPPQGENGSKGHRDNHDGPKSFGPPMEMPAPSSTTAP